MAENNGLQDKLKKFTETKQGKMAVVGAAVGVLVLVIVVVMVAMGSGSGSPDGELAADNKVTGVTTKSGSTAVPAPGAQATGKSSGGSRDESSDGKDASSDSFDVFQTRDPFKPLIEKRKDDMNIIGGSASTTSTTSTVANGPLALDAIVTRDGIRYGDVVYGGQAYELRDGQRVAGSPFQVLTVNEANVIFLYGDDRVVLKPGEKIFK